MTGLKTRVSELEVINELYRSTVSQYEQGGSQGLAPQAELAPQDTEGQLRQLLQQAQRREDDLKRRVDELKDEVSELRHEQPPTKKARTSEYPEPPSDLRTSANANRQ